MLNLTDTDFDVAFTLADKTGYISTTSCGTTRTQSSPLSLSESSNTANLLPGLYLDCGGVGNGTFFFSLFSVFFFKNLQYLGV